jgi:nucleoside phosphorylase
MLFIICALKSEAQAFVDKFKLQKSKLNNYTIFSNKNMMIIISGIGITNSTLATQTFIDHYDITDEDIYLNVGICGASPKHNIGKILEIGTIHYKHHIITLPNKISTTLTCLNFEMSENDYEIVDMESYGFYDAVTHSPAIKKFYIFKIVSDHFEPEKVTKDTTKRLVFNSINEIFTKIGVEL